MQQMSLIPPPDKEHGGILSLNCRRGRRPLSTKNALHITLRSDFAYGKRSLLKHRELIKNVTKKSERLFAVRVYRYAINSNHLHFVIRGKYREDLQNFFRVLAGHIAQQILLRFPLTQNELKRQAETQKGHRKNRRKFWALLLYSRIVSWGREFQRVLNYVLQNALEALNTIAYQPRKRRKYGRAAP